MAAPFQGSFSLTQFRDSEPASASCFLLKFGKEDAIRAFELLFADLASHKPERRRCARRVLQNAVGEMELPEQDSTFAGTNYSCVSILTHVQHAELIVIDAMTKLTKAATFERGSNLRYLVLALQNLPFLPRIRGLL
jgi:hypothetical protein